MRETTTALIEHYADALDLRGDVLEIGGHRLANCAIEVFPEPRYRYSDLNLAASDIPNTIIADITNCRAEIPDASFDVVISSDVFEHIDRPWLAAQEIARILRPGGIAVTHTLFAWRNHPCPIDYWRFSAECLEFLFADLECLEKGYDLSQRRDDKPGFWPSGMDSVPVDHLGGWRENWSVYCVNRKGPGDPVPKFKDSTHPLAVHLRGTTQGVVTSPKMKRTAWATPPDTLTPAVRDLTGRLSGIEETLGGVDQRLNQLQRQVRSASQPLPVRAWRGAARRLRAVRSR
jgi:SAM-dependent methyltransferase